MHPIAHAKSMFRLLGAIAFAFAAGAVHADTVEVMNSGGFSAAYKALKPKFEAASGHTLSTAWGPSMGKSPEAIPHRLARGEPADVLRSGLELAPAR